MSENQKVAIVTGASQGIAAGVVQGYLGRGYRVVANSRSIPPGKTHSPDVIGVPGDISDPEVDAVLYLESAGCDTGEALHVDGGEYAGKW
jgi:NAD(P)-dependent dehydrogenase (short-subunit alcohol dehydrogenase family)